MSAQTEPTLAEALRAYLHAENAVRAARRALPPECSAWPETSMASYLRGYDDARAKQIVDNESLATENNTLREQVRELEGKLEKEREWTQRGVRQTHEVQVQCASLRQELDAARAELATMRDAQAVGVVGEVRWGVLEVGDHMISRVWNKREGADHYRWSYPQTGRVVAIVDPDAMVPLQSTDVYDYDRVDGAADIPLYAGTPQRVGGEA